MRPSTLCMLAKTSLIMFSLYLKPLNAIQSFATDDSHVQISGDLQKNVFEVNQFYCKSNTLTYRLLSHLLTFLMLYSSNLPYFEKYPPTLHIYRLTLQFSLVGGNYSSS